MEGPGEVVLRAYPKRRVGVMPSNGNLSEGKKLRKVGKFDFKFK